METEKFNPSSENKDIENMEEEFINENERDGRYVYKHRRPERRSYVDEKEIKEQTFEKTCYVKARPFKENNRGEGYQDRVQTVKLTNAEINFINNGGTIYSEDETGWEEIVSFSKHMGLDY